MPKMEDHTSTAPDGLRRVFRVGGTRTSAEESPALARPHRPLVPRTVSDDMYRRIYEQAGRDLELIRHGG